MMNKTLAKMNPLTRGIIIFAILAVLTGIEYILGINEVPSVLLWLIALIKVGLVLWYFMHLSRIFNPDGGHE
ncbi:MAG: cytochrome C oxidase subunit IV family protein [Anaerolineaceae bacterium]|nr:cytochrome C oxidase subunit IV family protein [Anaerolineaceae bacterium]